MLRPLKEFDNYRGISKEYRLRDLQLNEKAGPNHHKRRKSNASTIRDRVKEAPILKALVEELDLYFNPKL